MTVEEKLKQLILSRYKSIMAFAKDLETPYSTIDNIFKRGVMGVGVTTAIKICNKLNIDVDKLVEGEIVNKDSNKTNPVQTTPPIIEQYNKLNSLGQQKADEYINDLVENPKYVQKMDHHLIDDDIMQTINTINNTFTNAKLR